jgi:hypothetical protein
VHDIVKPVCDQHKLVIHELYWIQGATVIISLFAIAVGFTRADGIYELLFISYECTPVLVFPLWSGVLGFKPDKHTFYMTAGVTTVVLFLSNT